MKRGEIWWADLPDPVASEPGYRRPLVVIQIDEFNRSRIKTLVVVVLTTNLRVLYPLVLENVTYYRRYGRYIEIFV